MGTVGGNKVFRHALCVGPCCDCAYFADKFDSEWADILADKRFGWTVIAPDPVDPELGFGWEIEYHKLRIEASESLIECDVSHPEGTYSTTIELQIGNAAPEDNARIVFNYTDTDKYHFVQVEWGASGTTQGTIRLGKRTAGVDDLTLGSDALGGTVPYFPSWGGWVSLRICIDDSGEGDATLKVFSNHGAHFDTTIAMDSDKLALGVGWGTANTGIVEFDGYRAWDTAIADIDTDCPPCAAPDRPRGWCPLCAGETPRELQIVIADMEPAPVDGCPDCPDLNGTYVLQPNWFSSGPGYSPDTVMLCSWTYTLPSLICWFELLALYLLLDSGGNYSLAVFFWRDSMKTGAFPDSYNWTIELGSALPECMWWNGLALTFKAIGLPQQCATGTAEVTALPIPLA